MITSLWMNSTTRQLPTYQKLLAYYQPRILLGLTATPERMDGKSILPYFNNRIAAEIRLPESH